MLKQIGTVQWHIKKQAVVLGTVAILKVNALALKSMVARQLLLEISSFVSVALVSMRAEMLVLGAITHCSPKKTGL